MSRNAQLKDLINHYFDDLYKMFPTTATVVGIHDRDGELDHFDADSIRRFLRTLKTYEKELAGLTKSCSAGSDLIDAEMLRLNLHSNRRNFGVTKFWQKNPLIYSEIVLTGLYLLLSRRASSVETRANNLISRLKEAKRVLAEARENLLVKEVPVEFIEAALKSLNGAKEIFEVLLPKLARDLDDESLRKSLFKAQAEGWEQIESFKAYLNDLKGKARGSMVLGRDPYLDFVRNDYYLPYSLAQIERFGWRELVAYEKRLAADAREINKDLTWPQILAEAGKQKIAENEAQLMKIYEREVVHAAAFIKKKKLLTIPKGLEIKVIETPQFKRATTPYISTIAPAPFDKDQTGYVIVTPTNETWRHFGYEVVVAHEAVPGHLFHRYVHNVSPRISPERLKLCGVGMFVERKQPRQNQFDEGWSVYVEEMLAEEGYFRDPKIRLLQLKMQYWRAARTVADVNFHTGRWSLEQAIQFFVEKVGHTPEKAREEIVYYSMKPTNHMAYLLGKLELLRLRKRAKGRYQYPKEFHDEILSYGSVPYRLIEKAMFANR